MSTEDPFVDGPLDFSLDRQLLAEAQAVVGELAVMRPEFLRSLIAEIRRSALSAPTGRSCPPTWGALMLEL